MIFTMNSNSLELNLEASLAVPKLPSPIILVKLYLQCKVKHRLVPRKHRRDARGVAPASDAAMREGRRCPRVRPRLATFFFFFFFFSADSCRCDSDSGQFTLNWASSRIRRNRQIPKWPIQAEIKKKKKTKKKTTWEDAAGCTGNGVPRASSSHAALDAGAAPLALCSCFPEFH